MCIIVCVGMSVSRIYDLDLLTNFGKFPITFRCIIWPWSVLLTSQCCTSHKDVSGSTFDGDSCAYWWSSPASLYRVINSKCRTLNLCWMEKSESIKKWQGIKSKACKLGLIQCLKCWSPFHLRQPRSFRYRFLCSTVGRYTTTYAVRVAFGSLKRAPTNHSLVG